MAAWHTAVEAKHRALYAQCLPQAFYDQPRPIGLAVSGGSDSLAMLYLVAGLKAPLNLDLRVVTVDHGLRPEAADEAEIVAHHAQNLGLPHDTLRWTPPAKDATGNLMAEASNARYAKLAAWAKAHGAREVLIAHTADDQAETLLMGLARAAGLDGLSGMAPCWSVQGTTFHRPLLAVTRERLRDYLRAHAISWIDDPSNENPRYTRVRVREALRSLAPLGITAENIAQSAQHLAEARRARETRVAQAFARFGHEAAGALRFDLNGFLGEGPDVQRRLLTQALRWFSGARHPARGPQMDRFWEAALTATTATLHGVALRHRRGQIELTREHRAALGAAFDSQIWDHRWRIHADAPPPETQIRALGPDGLSARPNWREQGFSRPSLLSSPSFWHGARLLYAPLLDTNSPFTKIWQVTLHPSFGSFIISH